VGERLDAASAAALPGVAAGGVGGIHKKILRLMEEVGAIAKDRSGQGINYKFRGIDDLYNQLHAGLRKAGVAMYPSMLRDSLKVETREVQRRDRTGIQTIVTFNLAVAFVDVDDGSNVTVVVPAQGVDDSDKAAGKAMSYGMKCALFHVLAIPTEDPDEERPDTTVPTNKAAAAFDEAGSLAELKEIWDNLDAKTRARADVVDAKDAAKRRLSK
jgi:hypothetical protein